MPEVPSCQRGVEYDVGACRIKICVSRVVSTPNQMGDNVSEVVEDNMDKLSSR